MFTQTTVVTLQGKGLVVFTVYGYKV